MNIEKTDNSVTVELESEKLNYSSDWFDEQPFLSDDGVKYIQEWKIDLVENHGVELNEL
jgi:hypothetical protein